MHFLIDTDILIHSLNDNKIVNDNFLLNKSSPKSVSIITYGELIYGANKSKNIEKNLAKIHRIAELFPIINISVAIIETFGNLKATLEKAGTTLDDMDLLIASTALTHNLVLVTNNEKHFKRIQGLKIVNWST